MKKRVFAFIALAQIISITLTPFYISQAGTKGDVKSAIRSLIRNDAGFHDREWESIATQTNKGTIPEAQIIFTHTDGEYYTAQAVAKGVQDPRSAYYTWYIRNDRNGDGTYDGAGDYVRWNLGDAGTAEADRLGDGSGIPLMDLRKIAATRERIKHDYDIMRYDSTFGNGGVTGNGDWIWQTNEYPATDTDEDGYQAFVGGDSAFDGNEDKVYTAGEYNSDDDNYCYIYDRYNGIHYELVEGGGVVDSEFDFDEDDAVVVCDEGYHAACYKQVINAQCPVFIEETQGEATAGGSSTGTLPIEGTPATGCDADGNNCATEEIPSVPGTPGIATGGTTTIEGGGGPRNLTLYSCQEEGFPVCEFNLTPVCEDGSAPVCIPDDQYGTILSRQSRATVCTDPSILGDFFAEGLLGPEFLHGPQVGETLCETENGVERCTAIYADGTEITTTTFPDDGGTIVTTVNIDGTTTQQVYDAEGNLVRTHIISVSENGNILIHTYDENNNLTGHTESGNIDGVWTVIHYDENGEELFRETAQSLQELLPADINATITENIFGITAQQVHEVFGETVGLIDPRSLPCAPMEFPEGSPYGQGDLPLPPVLLSLSEITGAIPPTCAEIPKNEYDLDNTHGGVLENLCTEAIHLYPFPAEGVDSGGYTFVTGDNSFGIGEERFWGTDPENGITVKNSRNDEAMIAGLGQESFTWKYHEGDEIGVVIESRSSSPTSHNNASYETIFAFLSDGCQPGDRGAYKEKVRKRTKLFLTTDLDRSDLNECLANNFITPGREDEEKSVEVEISGPNGPVVTGANHELTFEGSLSDKTTDLEQETEADSAYYTWRIDYAQAVSGLTDIQDFDPEGAVWTPITPAETYPVYAETVPQNIFDKFATTKPNGIGVRTLKVLANFPTAALTDGTNGFIRVRLEVNAPSKREGHTRYGRSEHIFGITQATEDAINVYRVEPEVVNQNLVAINESHFIGNEICANEELCDTVKGTILAFGLDGSAITPPIPNFNAEYVSWELDDLRIDCDPNYTDICNTAGVSYVTLPMLDNNTEHVITAKYSDPNGGDYAIKNFFKKVNVVEPSLTLVPVSGATPKVFGAHISVDGSPEYVDESEFAFDVTGAAQFTATLYPDFLNNYTNGDETTISESSNEIVTVEWLDVPGVDDEALALNVGATSPSFALDPDSTINTLEAQAYISIPQANREIIYSYYGEDQFTTSPQNVSSKAILYQATQATTSNGFSSPIGLLAYNSSEYILVLLKTAFVMILILFVSSVVLHSGSRRSY